MQKTLHFPFLNKELKQKKKKKKKKKHTKGFQKVPNNFSTSPNNSSILKLATIFLPLNKRQTLRFDGFGEQFNEPF